MYTGADGRPVQMRAGEELIVGEDGKVAYERVKGKKPFGVGD